MNPIRSAITLSGAVLAFGLPAGVAGTAPHTPAPPNGATGAPQHQSLSWQFEPGAEGVVMYAAAKPSGGSGSPGPSDLYRVDLETGAFTLVGPIGFSGVNGMTFGPDGVLYAAAAGENPPGNNPLRADLIRIDPATGAGTFLSIIGSSSNPTEVFRVVDMTTSSSGTIFGIGYRGSDTSLFTIDPASGVVNILGPVGFPSSFLMCLDFSRDGVLRGIARNSGTVFPFVVIDPMNGAMTQGTPLVGFIENGWVTAGDLPGGVGSFYFGGRDYNPDVWRLMRAEPATGVITLDVAAPIGLDGLASTSAATYDVYLDTANPPTTLVCDDTPSASCDVGPLQRCTTYFWRVVAEVNGTSVEGPVWSFETGFFSVADTDGDGDVDFIDLNNVLSDFGMGPICPAQP